MQAFPAALSAEEADPFLMADFFDSVSDGVEADPDAFPIGWHPHRGMDICTYMLAGVGRHADSMGNRETFASPGMQWCSVGSGIYHAEAGGTPLGERVSGFQLWLNVPAARKMDAPRYGTIEPSGLPALLLPGGVSARLLAGSLGGATGPFSTVQPVQMLHYELPPGAALEHAVPPELNNAMLYVFKGGVAVGPAEAAVAVHGVAHFAAGDAAARTIALKAGLDGASLVLFAGKRLNESIAWRGPIVMTTQEQLAKTFAELRSGDFPPVRVPW